VATSLEEGKTGDYGIEVRVDQTSIGLAGHEGGVSQVEFSPDGQYITTVGNDGTFRLWDRQGKPVAAMTGHEGGVSQVEFSPDGQYIATVDYDGIISLWDRHGNPVRDPIDEGKQLKLIGHWGQVSQIIFSPDGKSIATVGADDETIRIWTLPAGRQVAQYNGVGVLRPDWSEIAVVDPDYGLQVWSVYTLEKLDQLLMDSCQRLRPYISSSNTINPEEQQSLLRWCTTGE
jgi:WD40 repeat protein